MILQFPVATHRHEEHYQLHSSHHLNNKTYCTTTRRLITKDCIIPEIRKNKPFMQQKRRNPQPSRNISHQNSKDMLSHHYRPEQSAKSTRHTIDSISFIKPTKCNIFKTKNQRYTRDDQSTRTPHDEERNSQEQGNNRRKDTSIPQPLITHTLCDNHHLSNLFRLKQIERK